MSWNRPSESPRPVQRKKPSAMRGIAAGVAIIVPVLALCLFFLSSGDDTPKANAGQERGRIKTVKPVSAGASDAVASSKLEETNKAGRTKGMLADGDSSNASLSSLPLPGDMPTPPPAKMVFDNASDQLIAMTLSGNGRSEIAPLPFDRNMDAAFKKSLETPIVINDDDSEAVKAVKQRVIDAREDIKVMLKEGKTVRQILEEHRDEVNYKAGIRRETTLEARRILESGDVEGAKKYVTIMNVALQQIGVEEIEMPKTKAQILEERQRRLQEINSMKGIKK